MWIYLIVPFVFIIYFEQYTTLLVPGVKSNACAVGNHWFFCQTVFWYRGSFILSRLLLLCMVGNSETFAIARSLTLLRKQTWVLHIWIKLRRRTPNWNKYVIVTSNAKHNNFERALTRANSFSPNNNIPYIEQRQLPAISNNTLQFLQLVQLQFLQLVHYNVCS
jgi:hypothetical protein